MTFNNANFSDIENHWARPFIEALAAQKILNGYRDGTFRPDKAVTRAELAAIVGSLFVISQRRKYIPFVDIAASHWAMNAIKKAYEGGFVSGYPDGSFRPNDEIIRSDVLVALVNGLGITGEEGLVNRLAEIYEDGDKIPSYARSHVAIATEKEIVVCYPNIKLLNPRSPATRGDIAAMVYQTLVWLGRATKIGSDYVVMLGKSKTTLTVKVAHRREFRGAWMTTVWNKDWPSKPGLAVAQQQGELVTILNRLQALNFNALVLQVRPEGDALYASEMEPWSAWITGVQGLTPEPFYDPLEFAIAECHKRNIELHAWFNPYRAKATIKQGKNASNHIAVTNPEVVYEWDSQLWMDPGNKIVQDRAYNVMMDVVRRYDIDGIHLDDYFYPYPIAGKNFPDDKTYAAYLAGGGKLSLGDWRRENVNQMVRRLFQGIKSLKPYVKFGISPFGIYRPGQPAGITGLDAYNVLYADAKKWLEQGWIDYVAPQLYWRTDQAAQSYSALLKWWTEVNVQQRHIYVGNDLSKLDGKVWKNEEIDKQVRITRNLAGNLALGNIFFGMSSINQNREGIADRFQNSFYPVPAIVPAMSWQNSTLPLPPQNLQVNNRRLGWQPGNNQPVRSWALYRQSGDGWILQRVLSAGTTFATVKEGGTYAVSAVDRLANESMGVVITV